MYFVILWKKNSDSFYKEVSPDFFIKAREIPILNIVVTNLNPQSPSKVGNVNVPKYII